MQTFLPYPDFAASARVLDPLRLGKQRVETFQILRALTWGRYGWKNHPAVRMWRGFVPALVCYGVAMAEEWALRGNADATRAQMLEFAGGRSPRFADLVDAGQVPPWLGRDAVHASHRSALVRKDPEYYRTYFPDVPDDLPYAWPAPSFPRWPVLRGGPSPLTPGAAADLLGVALPEDFGDLVADLAAGRERSLPPLDEPSRNAVGVAAGLCTPGRTAWVSDAPAVPLDGAPVDLPGPPVRTGRKAVSASIARPATPEDAAAMRALATAEPEFVFLRRDRFDRLDRPTGVGLVIVEPDAPAPAWGIPVLRLSAEAGEVRQ